MVDQAEMALRRSTNKMWVLEVLIQPLAFGRYSEQVLLAVPEQYRTPHLVEVDVPHADPGNVVPGAAVHTIAQSFAHRRDQGRADHVVVHQGPVSPAQLRFERGGNGSVVSVAHQSLQLLEPFAEAPGGTTGITRQVGMGVTVDGVQPFERTGHELGRSGTRRHTNTSDPLVSHSGGGQGEGSAARLPQSGRTHPGPRSRL